MTDKERIWRRAVASVLFFFIFFCGAVTGYLADKADSTEKTMAVMIIGLALSMAIASKLYQWLRRLM